MKLCRFDDDRLGVVDGDKVRDVTGVIRKLPPVNYPLPRFDPLIARLDELRPAIEELAAAAETRDLAAVKLLSPVANPGKLIGAPVNYREHFAEGMADARIHHHRHLAKIREIALFLKATSSLVGAGEGVRLRHLDRRNDHEVELAVIIGRVADRLSPQTALRHVAGYCIGLDMTTRGPEDRSFRKSIDSYSVLGPWLVTPEEIANPGALDIWLEVNGARRQQANTRELLVDIPELIAWASSFYTLHPGDVIFTGTPAGVGPVVPGDRMLASITGIGAMEVAVRAA
ncbi:MAG: fumarylacetoacetate hydrolase family protein [Steroidobacteraceae bacterium]